jgi:SecD/SecF fusion protein
MAGSLSALMPAAVAIFAIMMAIYGGLSYGAYSADSKWVSLACFGGLIAALFLLIRSLKNFFGKYNGRINFAIWLVVLLATYFVFLFQTGKYPMGIDLAGGTELIYVLDFSDTKKNADLLSNELEELKAKDPQSKDIREKQNQLAGMQDGIRNASDLAAEVVRRRVDPTGTKGIPVTTFGSDRDRLRIMLPRATPEEVKRIRNAVETQGQLAFHIVETNNAVLQDVKLHNGTSENGMYVTKEIITPKKFTDKTDDVEKQEIVVRRTPDLASPKIVRARHRVSQQGAGQNDFGRLTEANTGKQMAIVLDGTAYSAPVIKDAIFGECVISGDFDEEKAKKLASVLQAGSLPAVVKYENEYTVGPTLGSEQIQSGMKATLIATVAVIGFVLFYYRLAGTIAAVCTVLNVLMLLGMMGFFKATLTLPGIAAIVLTLGMAIDANVLILERLREELERGRALRLAVTQGFDRAFVTIIDCNLTTLISGVILYYLGTGPVKGFAVTLSLGILTTLFCNLWLNWILTEWLVSRDVVETFSFRQFFRRTNIDFMGNRKIWFTGTALACVLSAVLVATAGNSIYDVDFTGGTLIQFNFSSGKEQDGPKVKEIVENTINKAVSERSKEALAKINQQDMRLTAQTYGKPEANGLYKSFTITTRVTDPLLVEDLRQEILKTFKDDLEPEAITWTDTAVTVRMNSRAGMSDAEVRENVIHARDEGVSYSGNAEVREPLAALTVGTPEHNGQEILVSLSPLPAAPELRRKVIDAVASLKIEDRATGAISRKVTFGAAVADDLFLNSLIALFMANLGVLIYVWFRFEFSSGWGVGALIALIHDVLIASGAVILAHYAGMNILIDLNIIAALLTIVGFSVNDTIVVFDRIREVKQAHPTREYEDIVNEAVNATLSRTILTSLTVTVSAIVLLVFGGDTIRGMAWTLLVGFVAGTYSSIFIASPIMIWWLRKFGGGRAPIPSGTRSSKADSPAGAEI